MANLFFLAAVCMVLVILLILLVFVILAARKSTGVTRASGESGSRDRREEAIRNLHAVRVVMREERPDLVESAKRAQSEAMKREIEAASLQDPKKAAGNLQKLLG